MGRPEGAPAFSRVAVALASIILTHSAGAQIPKSPEYRFEAGAQVAGAMSGEFEGGDPGIGGRVAFRPAAPLRIEAELNIYPRAFPGPRPFSRGRIEGLFGLTAGPTYHRVRPFARFRPGFLAVRDSPRPFACIRIFPPPLPCVLGEGRTLPAVDLGGGLEVSVTPRTLVRIDVGDRLLRYPAPVFDDDRMIHQRPFFGHDARVAMGAALRF